MWIRARVGISGLGANPWVLEASVAGLTGLAPGIGAVVDNSSGLDFVANFKFLATVDWDLDGELGDEVPVAINSIPQAASPPDQTVSSVSGAFYSVPEPSLAMLLGLGFLGLAARRSRSL